MAEYSQKLKDARWIKFRATVLDEHGHQCDACGAEGVTLQVHHLVYRGEPWEAAWDELAVLCVPCHTARHKHMQE